MARLTFAVFGMAWCTAWAQAPWEAVGAPDRREPVAVKHERAFWVCDYVATTRGVLATPMEACARATDELKDGKFGGDYDRLVQWWSERKAAEHQKLRLEEPR